MCNQCVHPNLTMNRICVSFVKNFFLQNVALASVAVRLNWTRLANSEPWIAPKCIWRPGSVRSRWGSYSAPQDSLAVIGERREGHGEEGEGKGGGWGLSPPSTPANSAYAWITEWRPSVVDWGIVCLLAANVGPYI